MGRPKITDGTRKDCTVIVRLTQDERDAIDAQAAAAGMDVSDWLRDRIIVRTPQKMVRDAIESLYGPVTIQEIGSLKQASVPVWEGISIGIGDTEDEAVRRLAGNLSAEGFDWFCRRHGIENVWQ